MTRDEERALALFSPGMARMPAGLVDARNAIYRNAADHCDLAEYLAAVAILADAATRIREIAATCSRAGPLNEVATYIEDEAPWPLQSEAMAWNDDRDARIDGNRLDNSRAWHPRDLGGDQ